MQNQFQLVTIETSSIKTDLVSPQTEQEILKAISTWNKSLPTLKYPIVHKGTLQLIGNYHLYENAINNNQSDSQVVLHDFPEEHLITARALYGEKPTSYAEIVKLAPIYKTIFNNRQIDYTDPTDQSFIAQLARKHKGKGNQFRPTEDDTQLRTFVAKLLGTNPEYLRKLEAIAKYDLQLLSWLDKELPKGRRLSIDEVYPMVPKQIQPGQPSRSHVNSYGRPPLKPCKSISEIDIATLRLVKEIVPESYKQSLEKGEIPQGLSIFTQTPNITNLTFQLGGRTINTQIADLPQLTNILKKAS